MPYLTVKECKLLGLKPPDRINDYDFVMRYLLHKFLLTPKRYRPQFDYASPSADVTKIQLVNGLYTYLRYYLGSQNVITSNVLEDLLAADRL